ncbi:MAG: hypothetical protein D6748_10705 [Calditrichaeota bacterium]|nr:MAG: hypothetical protein D6748_10705 [Calditrichota bacterium]
MRDNTPCQECISSKGSSGTPVSNRNPKPYLHFDITCILSDGDLYFAPLTRDKGRTMAKVKQKAASKKPAEKFHFPLGKTNYMILVLGVILLIVGFVFMALPDDPDAFLTRTLAPIILVFSFLVVIPFGIMYKEKK